MRRTAVASLVLSGLFIAGCGAPQSLPFSSQDGISTPMSAEPAAVSSDAGSSCSESSCPIPGNTWSGGEKKPLKPAMHCPEGMVFVSGLWCPKIEEVCLFFVDMKGNHIPENPHTSNRCGEFQQPSKCLTPIANRPHKEFCIDKYEWPNVEGQIPQDWMSWYDAKKAVEAAGKRLCTNEEWTMAAEGPDLHPLPYGDGYHRDKAICNFDNDFRGIRVDAATSPSSPAAIALRGLLVPSGSEPRCCSDYGMCQAAGNVDEWVVGSGYKFRSLLKGGHVFGVRNNARSFTDGHGPGFRWYETSTRSCKDAISE